MYVDSLWVSSVSSEVPRPGITHGAYPERESTPLGTIERYTAQLQQWIRPNKLGLEKLEVFAARVEKLRKPLREQSDKKLHERTAELRQALFRDGVDGDLAAPTFALISEQARRTLGLEPYTVQIMGGYAMLRGTLAEMATGEGKTLTATLPTCCAALAGIPVHVITVNDYLVERDAELMRPLYETLGLSVGVVLDSDTDVDVRRKAYGADITYVTNKTIAFDYLRDRMARGDGRSKLSLDMISRSGETSPFVLRGLCYAIIDEADSVLVDEAGTPLILSQTVEDGDLERLCVEALEIADQLDPKMDYAVDLGRRSVEITTAGSEEIAILCGGREGVWCAERRREELITQAIQATHLYRVDEEYLIRDDKIMIIDRNTGRVMPDRSWEMGLHQMIEAKEGVEISGQRKTLARITYQRFYKRYLRLCGMTGTAHEVRHELSRVYDLETVPIRTRRPLQRMALPPRVFATGAEKWRYTLERIGALHSEGRPILVGTRSVGESETLSGMLQEAQLPHEVLNARQDHREADIVADAGAAGRITIATNMAGRGTDIKIDEHVLQAGGLHVISTARSEAGRVDRQLYGRCGRQGNPGSYECLDSLDDDVITTNIPGWILSLLSSNCQRPDSLGHRLALKLVNSIQARAEARAEGHRSSMMVEEERQERALAFSGTAE